MDTTWTKYVKILKSGDHVICFNVSQGSTVSFSLEEFPNLVPRLRLRIWAQRNRGLLFGQRSQNNLGLPGGETELGDLKAFLTQQIFYLEYVLIIQAMKLEGSQRSMSKVLESRVDIPSLSWVLSYQNIQVLNQNL